MPYPTWNGFRLARCFAQGTARQPTPASAPRTVPQPVSSRSQIDLRPRPGSLPFSGADASCGCLPPQRCRYSNRVLVQCPVGLPMPPAVVCHLSAAGTPATSWSSACRVANASCGCLPPQRRGRGKCPGASPEDYLPARCFSQAQAEARVSSIGRSAFQPSSFSARVGSAQMATTSPGRRGANL